MMSYPRKHPEWYADTLVELLRLVADGQLCLIVSERIPLAEAPRAHELLAHGRHSGKVVSVTADCQESSSGSGLG